jgi:hypothetical protein
MMRVPFAGTRRGTAWDDGRKGSHEARRGWETGLSGADLKGASLEGVAPTLANLREANLAGAISI